MGYLGLTPTTAQQNYLNIDDISGSFNGTTTSFALQVGSVAPTPFPVTNSCLISVGGVIQEPDDTGTSGFRISGGNIVFSSAPGTGEDFFGLVLAGADYLNIGANFPDGTVGAPSITFDSDTNTGIYHPSADELSFVTGGSDRVRVDSNGRLGIGTGSPSALLSVFQSAEGEVANFGTSDTSRLLRIVTGTANSISGALITLKTDSAEGEIAFGTGGGTERVRIDNSGNVGIGTTPEAWSGFTALEVSEASIVSSGAGDAFFTANAYYDGAWKYKDAGVARNIYMNSDGIVFRQAASGSADGAITWTEGGRWLQGGGLTFNGDTAAANALDDYEEGTFTPSINTGLTATYNQQSGRYVKIGKQVAVWIYVDTLTISGSSSDTYAEVEGLPFTIRNSGLVESAFTVGWIYNLSNNVDHAYGNSNTTNVILLGPNNSGFRTHWSPVNVWNNNDCRICLSGVYWTDS